MAMALNALATLVLLFVLLDGDHKGAGKSNVKQITCPDMSDELKEVGQRGVQFQSIVDARNKRVTQFFCGDETKQLTIMVRIGLRYAKLS